MGNWCSYVQMFPRLLFSAGDGGVVCQQGLGGVAGRALMPTASAEGLCLSCQNDHLTEKSEPSHGGTRVGQRNFQQMSSDG